MTRISAGCLYVGTFSQAVRNSANASAATVAANRRGMVNRDAPFVLTPYLEL
jgi:hypothetical protein